MTRIEKVIEQVKQSRLGKHRAWIYDENGKIKDSVLCCEVLKFLEECKDYEILEEELPNEELERINNCNDGNNTYNYGANVSNHINYTFEKTEDGCICVVMVHLYGDIRVGYSDFFAIRLEDEYDFYTMESANQFKYINNKYTADMNMFSELYDVYDNEKSDTIGSYYITEIEDLLKEIEKENR